MVWQFVFHSEGGQTAAANCQCTANFVHTNAVPSNLSVQQVKKHGFQGDEAVDITVCDNFLHPFAQLSALPRA